VVEIRGDLVTLRPATLQDRRKIYEWLARSDVTPHMYRDDPVPTWEEFCNDYRPYFFDDSEPKRGRCFVIRVTEEDLGQVNYNEIDELNRCTEIDIWMRSEADCDRGLGTDALKTLCGYLQCHLNLLEFFMKPSALNLRAIRSYEKAGFRRLALSLEDAEARYGPRENEHTIYMVKKIDQ
jgi:diamine N-acetyltransferase